VPPLWRARNDNLKMVSGRTSARFSSQLGLFNPEKQRFNLHIFGIGSVGSILTLGLAKLGFNEITVYDFDKVEKHNIPNQFFRDQDIGKYKTESLKQIIKDFSGIEINTINKKITDDNSEELVTNGIDLDSLVILAFDSLEARKVVFDALEGFPNTLIDIRMGGPSWEVYVIELNNEEDCKAYKKTLSKKTMDLPCGMQSILYCLLNIASEVSNLIVRINNKQPYKKVLKRSMNSYLFIGK